MGDYVIQNFLIERYKVVPQPDGISYEVHFRIYDVADTAKETILFRRSVMYTGDDAAFKQQVIAKVQALVNSNLSDAISAVDINLDELATQYGGK